MHTLSIFSHYTREDFILLFLPLKESFSESDKFGEKALPVEYWVPSEIPF